MENLVIIYHRWNIANKLLLLIFFQYLVRADSRLINGIRRYLVLLKHKAGIIIEQNTNIADIIGFPRIAIGKHMISLVFKLLIFV